MSQTLKTIRNNCAAYTWTPEGRCVGVYLEASSRSVKVSAIWGQKAEGKMNAIVEALAAGRLALGCGEGVYCLAGPGGGGWGMKDLSMPPLKSSEMRSALAYELRKNTPIPLERMTWGYRVLGNIGKDGKQNIRLVYVRTEIWRRWLEFVGGLGHVDLLLPPPVALDPLFAGEKVMMAGRNCFEYIPGENGRGVLPAEATGKSIREMLPLETLDLGDLENLPQEEQWDYVPAILLALYGLGKEVGRDSGTLPALPDKLRTSRYVGQKYACLVMLMMIVCFLGIGGIKSCQQKVARMRLIQSDVSAVNTEISTLLMRVSPGSKDVIKNLEAELGRYKFEGPELPDVLLELTKLIKEPAWMGGTFDWSTDLTSNVVPVTFTIREPAGDNANADLGTRLNESPILGDVSESKSVQNRSGLTERRFVLKARLDTDEEKEQLAKLMEERAALEKAQREEKRRLAAEQAEAEELDEPDGEE